MKQYCILLIIKNVGREAEPELSFQRNLKTSEKLQRGAALSTKMFVLIAELLGLRCSLETRNLANPLRIRVVVVTMLHCDLLAKSLFLN